MTARTWLYVPGHRDDRIPKAMDSDADVVLIDLEDAVPVTAKDAALTNTVEALSRYGGQRRIWVRVNEVGSTWLDAELSALSAHHQPPEGIRLPKAEDPDTVADVAARLPCEVHAILETALALHRAPDIARSHPQVTGISLGEADLAADLRTHSEGLDWARGWVVMSARASRLPSPVQSVWTDLGDEEGLARSSRVGRAKGFFGRAVIHPRQIAIVHEAYTPSTEEVARALAIVRAAAASEEAGESAVLDADGRFIDPAIVANAHVVIERAQPTQTKEADS